jgi:predicted dehydrogenase
MCIRFSGGVEEAKSDVALNDTGGEQEVRVIGAAVSSGRKPSPSGEDGLAANRLADAAYLSWREKRRVTLA